MIKIFTPCYGYGIRSKNPVNPAMMPITNEPILAGSSIWLINPFTPKDDIRKGPKAGPNAGLIIAPIIPPGNAPVFINHLVENLPDSKNEPIPLIDSFNPVIPPFITELIPHMKIELRIPKRKPIMELVMMLRIRDSIFSNWNG